mgnify:CR=1 FL=1
MSYAEENINDSVDHDMWSKLLRYVHEQVQGESFNSLSGKLVLDSGTKLVKQSKKKCPP